MADSADKDVSHDVHTPEHSVAEPTGALELPRSWKYRRVSVLGFKLPWYASPPTQLLIVSFVCFMCPGMFNALNGIGGGGQMDATANNRANTALYSTFSVVGFFAGTFTNKLGIRTALSFGGIGYSVYVASFLVYNHKTPHRNWMPGPQELRDWREDTRVQEPATLLRDLDGLTRARREATQSR